MALCGRKTCARHSHLEHAGPGETDLSQQSLRRPSVFQSFLTTEGSGFLFAWYVMLLLSNWAEKSSLRDTKSDIFFIKTHGGLRTVKSRDGVVTFKAFVWRIWLWSAWVWNPAWYVWVGIHIIWESPLLAIFLQKSNHMACVVAANGNGFGLYLLHFGVCDVCPGHLQTWTNCAWKVEINFLHQREMWRRVSITGLYSHLWHNTVLLLSVLVRDAVCLSRFNLQPAKDSLTLLCFFGNHTLTTIVVRLCLTDGGCPLEEIYFYDWCFELGSSWNPWKAWEAIKIEEVFIFLRRIFSHINILLFHIRSTQT